MIHDIPKPEISPAFTIGDIHKIREWDYERLKDEGVKMFPFMLFKLLNPVF